MPHDTTSARNWVWIRGLARHSGHWAYFEDSFRKKFPQDHIEMLDVRGNGNQSHAPSFLSIEENVRDLRARSQSLKSGPIHLLTISLGSMIGIRWADLFPKEIASLTVMNTSDGRHSMPYERLRPQNLKNIFSVLTHSRDHLLVETKIMEMIAHNISDPGKKEALARKFAETPPTSLGNVTKQLLAASLFRLPQKPPDLPVLILAGKGDRFVNPKCSERIAESWNAKVQWHETAGHDIPLEDPDWVNQQIEHFLN